MPKKLKELTVDELSELIAKVVKQVLEEEEPKPRKKRSPVDYGSGYGCRY